MKTLAGKILLIEDDAFMRDMIAMVLQAADYEVDGVDSGADALDRLQETGAYAAVISDMYLPDTDGLALYEEIRASLPELRFLILTGETDETVRNRAVERGIEYILKDENFAETLVAALEKWSGRKE